MSDGKNFSVNSAHHQAVNRLGEGLRATLFADSIIEGYEHTDLPILGIQGHPERMCCSQSRKDTVDGSELFKYFINLCEKSI